MTISELSPTDRQVIAAVRSYTDDFRAIGRANEPCTSFPSLNRDSTDDDIKIAATASMQSAKADIPKLADANERVQNVMFRMECMAAKAYVEGLRCFHG